MAGNIDTMLDNIDTMLIYEDDYPTIKKILATGNNDFIAAVIEEVINGNLYWSDFETVFPAEYSELVGSSIEMQANLRKEIQRLVNLRKWANADKTKYNTVSTTEANIELQKHLLSEGIINIEGDNKFWKEEYKAKRDDLLYSILRHNGNDSPLEAFYREKLFNAIQNGKYVFESDPSKMTLPANCKYENGKVYRMDDSGNILETYLVINPNDILFSANEYIVPINYKYQDITAADRVFMEENKMDEEDLRKTKALFMFLKYNGYIDGGKD